MKAKPQGRQPGFTLIELMITIVVLTLVLALGVPALTQLIANTRITSTTNAILGHLQYARGEAVKRGARIAVGPIKGDGAWLASQSWDGGFIVAAVDNASPPKILKVLRRVDGAELGSLAVRKNGANAPRFYFLSDGSASSTGTLTICTQSSPKIKRAVVVSTIGRVRASDFTAEGNVLTCPE